jgi:hypothetical protein
LFDLVQDAGKQIARLGDHDRLHAFGAFEKVVQVEKAFSFLGAQVSNCQRLA